MNNDRDDLERRIAASLERSAPAPSGDLLDRVEVTVRSTPQASGPPATVLLRFAALGGALAAVLLGAALLSGAVRPPSVGDSSREPATAVASTASPQASQIVGPSGWAAPDRYEYVVTSSCGERSFLGTYAITVERRSGVRSTARNGSIDLQGEIPSIEDLLAEAAAARESGADEVTVETDPADGHPTLIQIDYETDAIDDEACYEITEYRPLRRSSPSPTSTN
jgi:hypothetical protein